MEFDTQTVHVGEDPKLEPNGDVTVPISLSATFARKDLGDITKGFAYSRLSNPTREALERRLAALEGAKFGLAFSAGMAAEAAIAMSLLKSGDHVVAFEDLYSGTKELFTAVMDERFNVKVTYVDATDTDNVKRAIKPNTKMVWMETPSNPLLKLCDVRAIAEVTKSRDIPFVVDNTFASPYSQNPIKLGADLVIHSTTKYINGHSDSIGGAVLTSNDEFYNKIFFTRMATGGVLSPFDSFLVLRGLKTLAVRMKRHEENAMKVAKFLSEHKAVKKVVYPGLVSHPQYALAREQMRGFGGMVSFFINGGVKEVKSFVTRLKLITLAVSLGGVESLIEHPASMTHGLLPQKEKAGVEDSLLRLSVGIENVNDIISDLDQALSPK
jgi:cystathionine gamma-lyase